ncbi:protein adenylyltransferase SelO [Thioalkalivibrio sp.]|uniref:protein adenylyltransferase SelO n=1 Tax=Thioalkalivibrio sp. TaxID=2093813 RepID=UPI003976017C
MRWNFDNSYARLPEAFFARVGPVPVRAPRLVLLNRSLAEELGLDAQALERAEAALVLGGNEPAIGSEPIAQAYAGHQFGQFNVLGDGRAHLLGEHVTPDGRRVDIQFKGSGPTPYSRRGDGRAALGPMLREYLISEAMQGLGVPTTRSLAVVATGERVFRGEAIPGAVLTRVADSHIRVGTFEYAAVLDRDPDALGHSSSQVAGGGQPDRPPDPSRHIRALADYTLQRHYPDLAEGPTRYGDLLNAVMDRQAALIAQWMRIGFVHGVMNTDNMALSGETIDYGPCAFMDGYDPATVFSSIDRRGRYAFANQAGMAQWNLARFAETLLPLLDPEPAVALTMAEEAIHRFPALFSRYWRTAMGAKLGLADEEPGDAGLIDSLLEWMHDIGADYTNTFRDLASRTAVDAPATVNPAFQDLRFAAWHLRWKERLNRQADGIDAAVPRMRAASPAVIPRNHRVEEAIAAAVGFGDLDPAQRLLEALENPYDTRLDDSDYRQPPPPDQRIYQTFCGT